MKDEQVKSDYQVMLTAKHHNESGFALVAALIILLLLGVISATVLAFATSETRTASTEIKRTEAFYAAEAKLEDMTNQFNNLFQSSVEPPQSVLDNIANTNSTELETALATGRGYSFDGSTLGIDTDAVTALETIFGVGNKPFIKIPDGPYYGMSATVTPYIGRATATDTYTGTSVSLTRKFNNYLLPVFQFSLFSDGDIELDPGQPMFVSGRVHANKNVYALRNLLFTGNITAAGELVRDKNRGGGLNNKPDSIGVSMMVSAPSSTCASLVCNVPLTNGGSRYGSVTNGPNFSATVGQRGYHPGSPAGAASLTWDTNSIIEPARISGLNNGTPGHFNKQILTTSSQGLGIEPLTLPLGLDDVKPVELIKRTLPSVDTPLISQARYENKAQVRILIDDQVTPSPNDAGIASGGVLLAGLTGFVPIQLGPNDQCNALRIYDNSGGCSFLDAGAPIQRDPGGDQVAQTVRSVKNPSTDTAPNGAIIPAGSGIQGRIKIEVVNPSGTVYDVTSEILSMGMTVGEPNGIVRLQRPLWAAFMQNSFERSTLTQSPNSPTLSNLQTGAGTQEVDGEIAPLHTADIDGTLGFIKTNLNSPSVATLIEPGDSFGSAPRREAAPPLVSPPFDFTAGVDLNAIVPINVYNVREGWTNTSQYEYNVYRRGVTSVVDINMRNLARWLDGKFDNTLLNGTNARSTNIGSNKGYVVYVSDRRGDIVRSENLNSTLIAQGKVSPVSTTNGNVDNEDIYFTPVSVGSPYAPNGALDAGEAVIIDSAFVHPANTLIKDTSELPDNFIQPDSNPLWQGTPATPFTSRFARAVDVMSWDNSQPPIYFRRSVRLSNGEDLTTTCSPSSSPLAVPSGITITWTCGSNKLSGTKGITLASENMVYIAGNYNTKGVGRFRVGGSNLNTGVDYDYQGPQVPSSIICDAFFPLSKTWFDANAAMYPEGNAGGRSFAFPIYRQADDGYMVADYQHGSADSVQTAVRTAVMFGTTLSALDNPGGPARNPAGIISSGGMHSAPRFLEFWNGGLNRTWSFTGSMVTLFNSTQAFAPWESGVAYTPPTRNWSYDSTFSDPTKLPPGTPFFQYVQSSSFEQVINR